MCGLFGSVGRPPHDEAELQRWEQALDTLAHRGPNERRVTRGPRHFLGFRRLAILDLSPAGGQPQCRSEWDVVFNGEIYNHAILRARLRERGHTFQSHGDAEVLAAHIAEFGSDGIKHLEGMFALAAVHRRSGNVLLARDRFGIKPLFYTLCNDTLLFASEPRALLAARGTSPSELFGRAVTGYFATGLCWGERTVYPEIYRLPPGSFLRWQPGASTVRPIRWSDWPNDAQELSTNPRTLSTNAVRDAALAYAVEQAVADHMMSDVPVGVFLSGGIDSGLTAAFAVQAARATGTPLPTLLTVAFPNARHLDEQHVAAHVARHLGAPHRIVPMTRQTTVINWHALEEAFDEPFADSSALPTLLLNQTAAQHATVWLSGDGGDEAFFGYRHQATALRWLNSPWGRLGALRPWVAPAAALLPRWSGAGYRAAKLAMPVALQELAFWNLPTDPVLSDLLTPHAQSFLPTAMQDVADALSDLRRLPAALRLRAVDYRFFLAADGLVKMDRASMHHSLEVRVPLLDSRITALAAQWPADDLIRAGIGKQPLRRLAQTVLPPEVSQLRKQGFGVPLAEILTPEHERWMMAQAEALPQVQRWLQIDGLRRLFATWRHPRGRNFDGLVWRAIMFIVWCRRWA